MNDEDLFSLTLELDVDAYEAIQRLADLRGESIEEAIVAGLKLYGVELRDGVLRKVGAAT